MIFAQAMTTLKENVKVFYGDHPDKTELDHLTPPGCSFADWKKDVEATIRRGRTTKAEYRVLKLKFPDLKPVDPPEGEEKKDDDKAKDVCKTALRIKKSLSTMATGKETSILVCERFGRQWYLQRSAKTRNSCFAPPTSLSWLFLTA